MSEEIKDTSGTDENRVAETAAAAALEDINIEDSMARDYIDYSMSVIIGRALPDVRDGLKPVHRRCLFAMYKAGNSWNTKHLKSAHTIFSIRPSVDASPDKCKKIYFVLLSKATPVLFLSGFNVLESIIAVSIVVIILLFTPFS